MGKVFNMVGGGGARSPDLPIGSRINVTSDIGATIDITKGSLHYSKTVGRLPSAYQEVEYIQSSGTQYINLGLNSSSGYKVKCDVSWVSTTGTFVLLYGRQATNEGANAEFIGSHNNKHVASIYNYIDYDTISLNTKYKLEFSSIEGDRYFTINGTKNVISSTSTLSTIPIYLFAINNGGTVGYYASIKLYNFEMYDNVGILARNLVPCYRISDSVIGMYDTVNDVFYTNAGSGTFSKGADITQGTVTFTVNYSGTWQLSASKSGEETLTDTVAVLADDTDYNKRMFWRFYIYYAGDTGTFTASSQSATSAGGGIAPTLTYNASNMTVKSNGDGGATGLAYHTSKIDFTDYNTLYLKCPNDCTFSSNCGLYILTSPNVYWSSNNVSMVAIINTISEYTLDVSGLTGEYYVAFGIRTHYSQYTYTVEDLYLTE